MRSCILRSDALGFTFKTPDPFLFCVYHVDKYPAGNARMEAPIVGNGADFDGTKGYRMYHGEKTPGFPQHPHRGFETLTATMAGTVDHTDSSGNAGRYGDGDLQWMTAGKGVVHGEMFPLINQNGPNPTKFFQIWLNLPAKNKMCDPAFVMHWNEDIPKVLGGEGDKTKVTVWAGSILGVSGLKPTPDSWASVASNEVAVWHLEMQPGARFTLPPAAGGDAINRSMYYVEGESLEVGGERFTSHVAVTLRAGQAADLHNPSSTTVVELLILQGKPIGEPVAQQGPFVMNTQAELRQAFEDYRRTQFGGWPWPEDAVLFPREKGRFALINKVEVYPPAAAPDL